MNNFFLFVTDFIYSFKEEGNIIETVEKYNWIAY